MFELVSEMQTVQLDAWGGRRFGSNSLPQRLIERELWLTIVSMDWNAPEKRCLLNIANEASPPRISCIPLAQRASSSRTLRSRHPEVRAVQNLEHQLHSRVHIGVASVKIFSEISHDGKWDVTTFSLLEFALNGATIWTMKICGRVLIFDNCMVHNSKVLQEIIEAQGE